MPRFYRSGSKFPYFRASHFYGQTITIVSPLCAILLVVGAATYQLLQYSHVMATSSAVLHGTLSPLLKKSYLLGSANPQEQIELSIGLRSPRDTDLNAYLRDITHPGKIGFHRFLSPGQYVRLFSPSEASYNELLYFLRAAGFTITHTYSHRQLIAFRGTIAQAEQAFHVAINRYRGANGQEFYANDQEPSLPLQFARTILSLNGLNNAIHWHHAPLNKHMIHIASHNSRQAVTNCPGHGSNYLLPDQIAAAYNLQPLYNSHVQGEGQTMALFELNTFQLSDLTSYASCFSRGHTAIQAIPTGSLPVSTDAGLAEVELDAEGMLSTAPALGNLKIYEAANDVNSAIAEWAQIIQDAPPVVSTSWGLCEQDTSTTLIQQENALFKIALAQGQSIFAASGDSGSTGCAFDFGGNSTQLSAGDPGAQPYITSVGGTTLTLNGSSYGKEIVWNSPPNPSLGYSGGSAGGGISQYWTAPSWQDAPGVHNSYSTGTTCNAPKGSICRETPDVALHADPHKGFLIYCTPIEAGCNSGNPWFAVGGTSAATPIWASFATLVNQMSVKQGGANMGFVNPLLYQLARNASSYSNDFHDITEGNNDFNNANSGTYPATAGYDLASGLGSFNAANLAGDLVKLILQRSGTRQAAVSNTWYFAEGYTGNNFQEYLVLANFATSATTAQVKLGYDNGHTQTAEVTIEGLSQTYIDVNQLNNKKPGSCDTKPCQITASASAEVTSDSPIVATRLQYFHFGSGKYAGITDTAGETATVAHTTYSFAEGYTGSGFQEYLTLQNPTERDETIAITLFSGTYIMQRQASVKAHSRQTLDINAWLVPIAQVSSNTGASYDDSLIVQVLDDSEGQIVAERAMYFNYRGAQGGSDVLGYTSS